jgi:hypothetical protein
MCVCVALDIAFSPPAPSNRICFHKKSSTLAFDSTPHVLSHVLDDDDERAKKGRVSVPFFYRSHDMPCPSSYTNIFQLLLILIFFTSSHLEQLNGENFMAITTTIGAIESRFPNTGALSLCAHTTHAARCLWHEIFYGLAPRFN